MGTDHIESSEKRDPLVGERAMIEAILEGSPGSVGVAVIRLNCGCRKMAAVDGNGEPASEIIMYRDDAESICDQCKQDNGDFMRVTEQFIHWTDPAPAPATRQMIQNKVLGTQGSQPH